MLRASALNYGDDYAKTIRHLDPSLLSLAVIVFVDPHSFVTNGHCKLN